MTPPGTALQSPTRSASNDATGPPAPAPPAPSPTTAAPAWSPTAKPGSSFTWALTSPPPRATVPAPASAYPDTAVPDWYRDAKLGIFVHWGLYSVPAWADVLDRSDVTAETAYARHQYAEWYANTVRIDGSPTKDRHEQLHGVGHS